MATLKEAQAEARRTRKRFKGHRVNVVQLAPGKYGVNVVPTLKEPKLPIEIKEVKGRFRNIEVREGKRKAAVLHLKPDSRKDDKVVITKVEDQHTYTLPNWAARAVKNRTGISQRAIKKLGL